MTPREWNTVFSEIPSFVRPSGPPEGESMRAAWWRSGAHATHFPEHARAARTKRRRMRSED
jgi:hypothetical protein